MRRGAIALGILQRTIDLLRDGNLSAQETTTQQLMAVRMLSVAAQSVRIQHELGEAVDAEEIATIKKIEAYIRTFEAGAPVELPPARSIAIGIAAAQQMRVLTAVQTRTPR